MARSEKVIWLFFAATSVQLAFLSPYIILVPGERTNLFSGLLCFLSLVMGLIFAGRGVIKFRSPEFLVSAALAIIAIVSGLNSFTPLPSSFRVFVLLASGLGGFWCARLLLNTPENQCRFQWLCLILLAGVEILSLVGFFRGGEIHYYFFEGSNHPLPDLIFLLSFAPLTLLAGKSRPLKLLALVLLGLGYAVLCLSQRLSVVFIPIGIGILAVLLGAVRWKHLVAGLLVAGILVGLSWNHLTWFKLSKQYPYYRIENYFFSWNIAKQHPLLGIGLRTPRESFLKDYQIRYPYDTKKQFAGTLANIVTADNQIFTFLAGLGFPFTILYCLAVIAMMVKLIQATLRPPPGAVTPPLALLLPLAMALVHYQVYDGLLYPQNCWFFHILLGLIPNVCRRSAQGRSREGVRLATMKSTASGLRPMPLWVTAALLLAVPVLLFWRPIFFYVIDDWTALAQMVQLPFGKYLVAPDGEQWFPFFHLVYYGLVWLAGEHYSWLVLFNCLGTGANAFLVYLFFRRQLKPGLTLALSLLYAGAAVHHAIAWNAFYVGYLLSLGFFLGALLLTDDYLRRGGRGRLWAIGLCSLLSLLSHNYPLVGLLSLPLYALLVRGDSGRKFWSLAGTLIVVYLVFTVGYLYFAGAHAAASHNTRVFASLPGPNYLLHLFYGAILAPFFYLFWGFYHFPIWAYVAGITLLAGSLGIIWFYGGGLQRRLALWALLTNALPFLLISLTRYERSVNQAFVARYGIFTLIGALLLVGLAWGLLSDRLPPKSWWRRLSWGLLAVMALGQVFALPHWTEKYLEMTRAAKTCYYVLSQENGAARLPREVYRKFCPGAYPVITPALARSIRRFLSEGRKPGSDSLHHGGFSK